MAIARSETIAELVDAYDDGETGDDLAWLKHVGPNHAVEAHDTRVRSRVVISDY